MRWSGTAAYDGETDQRSFARRIGRATFTFELSGQRHGLAGGSTYCLISSPVAVCQLDPAILAQRIQTSIFAIPPEIASFGKL